MTISIEMLESGGAWLRRVRRAAMGVAVALVAWLAVVPGAQALSGRAIKVGTPLSNEQPTVAVDPATGTALIGWANTEDVGGGNDYVQYCVIPKGATGCSHSGSLIPADNAQAVDSVQVLDFGSTMVVLADVFGTTASGLSDYEPEQEWQSTDGGATWSIVNAGLSVASGIVSAVTVPLNAVIVPGTGVLGYGWETAGTIGGQPTFNAFPLSSPPECSRKTCGSPYATLEPTTNPDVLGNAGGQVAAEAGANPGILAIYDTDFTNGPLGCSASKTVPFGIAYAYGSGNQSAANDYNISPGVAGTAWKVAATLADCNVEYPAVGGGPSGFGVLEQNDLTKQTDYHRFSSSTMSFSSSKSVVAYENELEPSVSQDGAGNIYTTFLGGGAGGPVVLSYSANGGSSWAGPAVLQHNGGGNITNLASSVGGNGQGWAVWTNNGSVYAQEFDAADAAVAALLKSGSASKGGKTITVPVSCTSVPCSVKLTLTGAASLLHGTRLSARAAKTRMVTLGSGSLTVRSRGYQKLTVKLKGPGKTLLSNRKGRVKLTAQTQTKTQNVTARATQTVTVTIK